MIKIVVGLEDHVAPEPGPLELYQLTWPHRWVEWDRSRQLFKVMQTNPITGGDERYEILYDYDTPLDQEGAPIGGEALEKLLKEQPHAVQRRFRPFDYEFVRERRQQRFEFLHDGSRKYVEKTAREVTRIQRAIIRSRTSESAAALGEIRRWLPKMHGMEKIPLVPGGFTTRANESVQKAS
ncbi:MAG TPA: hypothetical protein VEA63_01735 [Opitutus sp.]|nr:hypothetical protein [Opitutus sp.]